jgi:hypothetical protein
VRNRLDLDVPVQTSGGRVTVSWQVRDELVRRLRSYPEAIIATAELEDAGAGRPARLEGADAAAVLAALSAWSADPSATDIPDGLVDLLAAEVGQVSG